MKIVKAELDDVMHADFKSWCAKRGTTMGKQIGWWIMNGLGEVGKVPEVKISNSSTKPVMDHPVNVVTPSGKYGNPVETGEVIRKKCAKCFDSFPVTELVVEPRTGKSYCPDCVENMKNGQ